jgi:mannose-6-phosphate isomerase-like protein (cupin superfamily)
VSRLADAKHIFKPEDYVDASVPEMGKFTRKMNIDSTTVGAKELTLIYGRYEGGVVGGNYERKCLHPNAEEIFYITGGKGYVGIDDKEYSVERDDTIWVPKDAVHWVYNPFEEPFEMLCVYSQASLKEAGLIVHG